MKAWIFGVFAVAGCNQIFGNHQATPFDGPSFEAGPDTAPSTMSVQYMVLAAPGTTPTRTKLGALVQVGALPPASLGSADIQPQDDEGNFAIPLALSVQGTAQFRVRYLPADGIPVDFITKQITAHLVVPSVGRLTPRDPITATEPAAQKSPEVFAGGPNGGSAPWTHGRFFEVGGVWAISEQGSCCIGQPNSVLANWVSLSGPQAQPTGANDVMVMTDSGTDGLVYGYGTVTATGFDGNGNPTGGQVSAWMTPTAKTSLRAVSDAFSYSGRAFAVVNDSAATTDAVPKISGGVIPSKLIFPFTGPMLQSGATAGGVEQLAFLPLAESLAIPMNFVDPFDNTNAALPMLPTAIVQRGSVTRTFTGTSIKVSSGITAIEQVDNMNTSATASFTGIALASNIGLAAGQGEPTMLLNADNAIVHVEDGVALGLSFAGDIAGTLNDCMVTLYRLDTVNNAITPTHRYLANVNPTVATPLLIEKGDFDLSSKYTFGISCFAGHPQASITSDWSVVSYPMAASTIYTKSFTVTN